MIVKNIYLRTGQYFKMVTCIATICAAVEKDTIKDFIIFNNSWDPISLVPNTLQFQHKSRISPHFHMSELSF